MIDKMLIRGAKVHNLKNIDVDIPLGKIVGIAGVSGSGKSSLALGVLYAEGLAAVSGSAVHLYPPPHDAGVQGQRGRGAVCPRRAGAASAPRCAGYPQHLRHGNRAAEQSAADVFPPCQPPLPQRALSAADPGCRGRERSWSARSAARTSTRRRPRSWPLTRQGACQHMRRHGHGPHRGSWRRWCRMTRLTIDEGAVAPWNSLMWSLMTDVCREMGVRTDVPFRDLTEREKDIVYQRPGGEKAHLLSRQELPIRPASWILPTLTPSTPWKTPLPRSRTKRA